MEKENRIRIAGIEIEWDIEKGTCTFQGMPVSIMSIDATLADLMSGIQAMVGTKRFLLSLQAEGRRSIEADWPVISKLKSFHEGVSVISEICAATGWGHWTLESLDMERKECRFRIYDSWEGRLQKSLGVCWGSAMFAGKLAGYCTKIFGTNCWAEQTSFIARGDPFDAFVVAPSTRTIEREIEGLLAADEATRADMAVALHRLEKEIAERLKSEEALRESEEKFRTLVEATSDWIWETDGNGRYTYASPRVRDLLGYEPGEVVGKTPFDFMPADEARRLRVAYAVISSERLPFFNLVNENRTKDGATVILETSGMPKLDAEGNLQGYRGIDRDITERMRAEATIRENRAFIQAFLDTSRDWIWAIDMNGVHTYSNPAIKTILGYEVKEIVGYSAFNFIAKEDKEKAEAEVRQSIAQKRGWSRFVLKWTHKDGGIRYLESNSVPILDADGKLLGFRGVDRDITERRRAEEDRLELERRLLHGQKLESLGVLAGGIAHDFNNLLMAILGNLDIALADLPPSSPVRGSVLQAMEATRRATDLTSELLAYSGKGRFIIESLNLSGLVRRNAGLFRAAISRKVVLNLSLSPDRAVIEADPGQVQQVIMNLITNASEAIGDNAGVISLATGVEDYDEKRIGESKLDQKPPAGRFAYVEVSDTGSGMDSETQQRLFDPFFTTKFTGRGLGMAAVLGIVSGHKGAIFVKSAVGKGTAIRVLFPVREAETPLPMAGPAREQGTREKQPSRRKAVVGPSVGAGSRTVLVVEDEEAVRKLYLGFLSRLGFHGIGATNGEDALKLFETRFRGISLVILDLTMPRLDGISTFRRMKLIDPNVKVMLTSGYDEQDAVRQFAGEGLVGFIKKPFHLNDLREKLSEILSAGTE